MKATQAVFAILVATGLAATPFAAQARHHKTHHSSMSVKKTDKGDTANPSSDGARAAGANQAGSIDSGSK